MGGSIMRLIELTPPGIKALLRARTESRLAFTGLSRGAAFEARHVTGRRSRFQMSSTCKPRGGKPADTKIDGEYRSGERVRIRGGLEPRGGRRNEESPQLGPAKRAARGLGHGE